MMPWKKGDIVRYFGSIGVITSRDLDSYVGVILVELHTPGYCQGVIVVTDYLLEVANNDEVEWLLEHKLLGNCLCG